MPRDHPAARAGRRDHGRLRVGRVIERAERHACGLRQGAYLLALERLCAAIAAKGTQTFYNGGEAKDG